ncbi:amidohydrolase [Halopseudomonas aestusnigri]|uniref:Amidohydrolase 3 domain-containing protein n=1 Tax=Halopseudomonas aestusnigri TaxID=857252 RepID=A0AAQ1JQ59_9GAMM|nr:amidohydrolase [Halopseudomonas aestusnigri]OWL89671.1 hypothetical protein B7O88_06505 [Halopseudomonas aestusnigri]SEG25108.1 hypothetical protein SAMN05216586_104249 [Halopseudomonas aestusnigri]
MSTRYTALALALFASIPTTAATGQVADSIYLGGPILTMDDQQPRAEAVAVTDGKIIGVGARAEIERAHRAAQTALHDLQGHALLPAFFDAHSHFSMVGLQAISANLLPPPDGPGSSIAELQTALREHLAAHPEVREMNLLIGFNYDNSQLAEKRHPTRQELDAVATDIPIVAIHQSGHLGVYNSLALKQAGIDATTVNPEGGVIIREADGVTPNGVMEENAHIATLIRLIPRFTAAQHADMLNRAQQIYLANGFTTVQEGRASADTVVGMQQAAETGLLKLDLVIYPDLEQTLDSPVLTGPLMSHDYRSHLRLGGVKLTFDGSPQGKTAWFTQPYVQPPEHEQAGYRGRPIFADDAVPLAMMRKAYAHGWQVLIHTNGDAAIDQMIRLVRMAQPGNPPSSGPHTVMIHGQYLRADQIPQLKALGIFPSLYPMHTFYWGDWHRTSVAGPERAAFISPTRAVQQAGMTFSIHSDAPVIFPDSMRLLHSAVNRVTRSGYVLGPDQRLDVETALKAMTLWPAWQHSEGDSKGSISSGKLADLIILDRDPTTVAKEDLLSLRVLETIKEGQPLYRSEKLPGS